MGVRSLAWFLLGYIQRLVKISVLLKHTSKTYLHNSEITTCKNHAKLCYHNSIKLSIIVHGWRGQKMSASKSFYLTSSEDRLYYKHNHRTWRQNDCKTFPTLDKHQVTMQNFCSHGKVQQPHPTDPKRLLWNICSDREPCTVH